MDRYSEDRNSGRFFLVFLFLFLLFLTVIIININAGQVGIPFLRILSLIAGENRDSKEYMILMMIRLPRIFMAALLGGALALSGYLLQTFFNNPIAGPFVLGISSGAKLMVSIALILSLRFFSGLSSCALIAASFAGSLISTGFILLISRKVRDNSTLLIAGIMIGYVASSVTDFILNFADDSNIVSLHGWSLGSFSGTGWNDVLTALFIVTAGFFLTLLFSKPIGAFLLGENYARSLGVNVPLFRILIILLSSMLSALVTAFAGPISFVGVAVPFLTKRAFNTSRTIIVIPGIFLSGAVFVMLCDLIARTAFSPTELSISTVTGILGAPVVILMLLTRKRGENR
ncbi:MAG: iron ABC transporter permease [Lachnospiraceae bacterium]|nr:iron ABC transporter permease [Lachnospiraceae bacterium]